MPDEGRVGLTVRVSASGEQLWSLIRRFETAAAWHPLLSSSRLLSGLAEEIGAERELVTITGLAVRERLTELDDDRRVLAYEALTFAEPVRRQSSRIAVASVPGGAQAIVTFSACFEAAVGAHPRHVVDMIGASFIAAANGLGSFLGVDVYVVAVDV